MITEEKEDTRSSKEEAFKNVQNQMGYCGIWCGSCVVGNGALREMTAKYREVIEKYGLKEWMEKDFDFGEFEKGLSSIQSVTLCPGCLRGGGRGSCEIKACALGKNIADCSECSNPEECSHTEILQHMRTEALRAGLFVKMENVDRKKLMEEWTSALRSKWPSCILFCNPD